MAEAMGELGYRGGIYTKPLQPKKKKKEVLPTTSVPAQTASAPAQATPAPTQATTTSHWTDQPWASAYVDALAAAKQATPKVEVPTPPATAYNPYTDPRFARIMQQLEQAISAPFAPKVEEHPAYQAAQARLQREAEEAASRAVQQMAARNILRSAMTEQALKDIAQGVVERLQTEVAPQVYQQLLSERQAQIQNLMSQLQAALSAAGFGAEEQARAFQQAMDVAKMQEAIRQFQEGQELTRWQALLPWTMGLTPAQKATLEQQRWEALLPWTMGLTPYQKAQLDLDRWYRQRSLDYEAARLQIERDRAKSEAERQKYSLLSELITGLQTRVEEVSKGTKSATESREEAIRDVSVLRAAGLLDDEGYDRMLRAIDIAFPAPPQEQAATSPASTGSWWVRQWADLLQYGPALGSFGRWFQR